LGLRPFGTTVLHGDVHSRNVVLRAKGGREQAVFIDWGRARLGSPLEDVSSWLESLGCWEGEVRRRHDTLLRHYLVACGLPSSLERTLRDAYWLASASNALAGALAYHLARATDATGCTARERSASSAAARVHLRVIRRADALWRAA
jgi:aminoglycoside phosphotransferase (APT) family kinase protein